jgi:hypothetical protein
MDNNNNRSINNRTDNSNGMKLFETYHGVKLNIDYFIGAEIKRSGLLGPILKLFSCRQ